ncbi:MAG: hypothetical protein ACP5PA_01800 [Elusimicrobiales bacterium]
MNIILFFICVFVFSSNIIASVNNQFYGWVGAGKSYFDGDSSSVDLNGDLAFSPVITLGDEDVIYPVYLGYFKGIEDLSEIAGGDVLVRQRMGHSFSVKYVKSKDFNHIKPRISYSLNYVNETKDESWGNGLFDYRTFSIGVEFEQERPDATYLEGFDFFTISYPNYSSLIYKYSTAIDTSTYLELSRNAGKDVLNSKNFKAYFDYTVFPKNLNITYSFALTYRSFYDQSVVNELGGFKSDKRRDLLGEFGFLLSKSDKKIDAGFLSGVSYLYSNQNSYDASRTKYIDDYYGYVSINFSPYFRLKFKNKAAFDYSFRYERINYTGRLAQDVNGSYLSSKIYQNFYVNMISFSYPISDYLLTRLSYSYQSVDSNMKYETGYRYNYTSGNILFGCELRF